MQPLASTRRLITWLSIYPADQSSSDWQKRAYVAHTLAVLIILVINFNACIKFCLKNISIDFNGAVFAFMCSVMTIGVVQFLVVAILMRHQIQSIFTNLSTIYKCNENDVEYRYLVRVNNTSEWLCGIYMKYIVASVLGTTVVCLLSVLYCYVAHGQLDVDQFFRPIKFVLPWNQSTHFGYAAEICFSIQVGYGYMLLNGTPLMLYISLCFHYQAFHEMFRHKIKNSKKIDDTSVCDLIRFHISAKDLFLESTNVYSPFVLVQLICSTVVMTVSVFYLDLQWHQIDFILVSTMLSSSFGISTLFIYCYFGKLATESYEMMFDCVYEMEWYEQPNELQKCFILMIANMQRPIYYHGFHVVNLDLRTIIKVCNSVFSYYMMIKTLAAK